MKREKKIPSTLYMRQEFRLLNFFLKKFHSDYKNAPIRDREGCRRDPAIREKGGRTPMTTKDKAALIVEGLHRICADVAAIAAVLEDEAPPDVPAEEPAPAPEKIYTYEEARAILAEKSRTGFRAEVKAILTKHGVTQLSDVKDPQKLAAIVADVEEIQVG